MGCGSGWVAYLYPSELSGRLVFVLFRTCHGVFVDVVSLIFHTMHTSRMHIRTTETLCASIAQNCQSCARLLQTGQYVRLATCAFSRRVLQGNGLMVSSPNEPPKNRVVSRLQFLTSGIDVNGYRQRTTIGMTTTSTYDKSSTFHTLRAYVHSVCGM